MSFNNSAKGKIPRSKKRRKVKRGKVLIWGSDYWSHDIPHFEFDDSENGYVFDKYFKTLKSINYPLISITVDDKKEMARACRRYYPDCTVQLCTIHYIRKINRLLGASMARIRIRAKENQIEKLFDMAGSTNIPVTRKYSIKRAVRLINEIADLEFRYELLIDLQKIIESILFTKEYKTAIYRFESLIKYYWPKRFKMKDQFSKNQINTAKKVITDFKEHIEYLLNHLKYPHLNIPSTSNLMEGYNSQLELRLNSIKGFETVLTAENYLNVWIIKRRFTRFTDCKNGFKNLNGKTPLECAGADTSSIRNWISWCQK